MGASNVQRKTRRICRPLLRISSNQSVLELMFLDWLTVSTPTRLVFSSKCIREGHFAHELNFYFPLIDWLIDWLIDLFIYLSIDWHVDWLIHWVMGGFIECSVYVFCRYKKSPGCCATKGAHEKLLHLHSSHRCQQHAAQPNANHPEGAIGSTWRHDGPSYPAACGWARSHNAEHRRFCLHVWKNDHPFVSPLARQCVLS